MQHYKFFLLVNNEPSVLARIVSLFAAKRYNIEAIKSQKTDDEIVAKIEIVAECDEEQIDQLRKQLFRLIDIIEVSVT